MSNLKKAKTYQAIGSFLFNLSLAVAAATAVYFLMRWQWPDKLPKTDLTADELKRYGLTIFVVAASLHLLAYIPLGRAKLAHQAALQDMARDPETYPPSKKFNYEEFKARKEYLKKIEAATPVAVGEKTVVAVDVVEEKPSESEVKEESSTAEAPAEELTPPATVVLDPTGEEKEKLTEELMAAELLESELQLQANETAQLEIIEESPKAVEDSTVILIDDETAKAQERLESLKARMERVREEAHSQD